MDHVQRQTWPPILTGGIANRAWAIIDAVARDPLLRPGADDPAYPGEGTLATGSTGLAIFYTYLSLAGDRDAEAEMARRHLEASLHAAEQARLPPGLFDGISGIGWTYAHLYGRLEDGYLDDETITPFDSAIIDFLSRAPGDDEYDLISGLVGYGVYALEQEPAVRDRILKRVIARLAELAEQRGGGITWFTPASRLPSHHLNLAPDGYCNLGIAHGVAGVIALLGSAARAGRRLPRVKQPMALLPDAIAWLREQRTADGASSAFPSWTAPGSDSPPSRLAWCYGDAGLAVAWLVAARGAGRADWEEDAIDIAHRAGARTLESSGVVDAGLCHGAAGVAHIFNRLFQATGDQPFRDAAHRWFAHALTIVEKEGPFGGGGAGLLTGAAGVGLALLAACTDVEPEWDRALLLDVPGRAVNRASRRVPDPRGS